jgi:hypothetical protein
MKRGHRRPRYDYLDATVRGILSSLKKQYTSRRDKICLDSGYNNTETWGALKKCWKGYKIAKSESDYKNMEYYANGIRKFERELNISVTDFPQFGLIGPMMPHEQVPVNDSYGHPYDQTDLEDYELPLKREQELDPYTIELEPNLWKEQAEYYKRIHRNLMGDYSDEVW